MPKMSKEALLTLRTSRRRDVPWGDHVLYGVRRLTRACYQTGWQTWPTR